MAFAVNVRPDVRILESALLMSSGQDTRGESAWHVARFHFWNGTRDNPAVRTGMW